MLSLNAIHMLLSVFLPLSAYSAKLFQCINCDCLLALLHQISANLYRQRVDQTHIHSVVKDIHKCGAAPIPNPRVWKATFKFTQGTKKNSNWRLGLKKTIKPPPPIPQPLCQLKYFRFSNLLSARPDKHITTVAHSLSRCSIKREG